MGGKDWLIPKARPQATYPKTVVLVGPIHRPADGQGRAVVGGHQLI